ncbi:MAG: hypothetical protein SVU32_00755 [Candidatus Nanohaloarchaea archaeon]|nr:hypothetical protein [Candidatus Nanohaloarchaea archaeon]
MEVTGEVAGLDRSRVAHVSNIQAVADDIRDRSVGRFASDQAEDFENRDGVEATVAVTATDPGVDDDVAEVVHLLRVAQSALRLAQDTDRIQEDEIRVPSPERLGEVIDLYRDGRLPLQYCDRCGGKRPGTEIHGCGDCEQRCRSCCDQACQDDQDGVRDDQQTLDSAVNEAASR